MPILLNTERLSADVSKKFIPFIESLFKVHGDNILSVFLYGSAVGKNYIPGISDINSVFIFRTLDFYVFQRSLKIIQGGLKRKITPPLFLSQSFIESSRDVFSVELLEMKENHILLYGDDILTTLEVPKENLRLLCEQQLKGKLLRIRQSYLEMGLKTEHIRSLLKISLNSLFPVFRNLFRLREKEIPDTKERILSYICQDYGLHNQVFLSILMDKKKEEKIAAKDVEPLFQQYLTELETLVSRVDQK